MSVRPLLVLSAEHVQTLTRSITAEALTTMIGRTMHSISADAKSVLPEGAVPPIQNPLRIATESERHKTLYMPSRLTTSKDVSLTAIKVVAVPKPSCPVPGLPATTLVFDEETGDCSAVVNAAELTGLRTAAASALATKLLADTSSTNLVVFGTGVQSYYHARLILELFPSLTSVAFVARQATSRSAALVAQVQADFPKVAVTCVLSEQTSSVVKLANIICTCVPSTEPIFEAEDLLPGVHINAIGSYTPKMREFPPSLLSPTSSISIPTILVDSRSACLSEAGELIAAGIAASCCIEIGEAVDVAGAKIDGFEQLGLRKNGRSLFKCVGVGGMDVAITGLVVEMAKSMGVGTAVPY
ncbi:hypothetical protein MNV49_007922 [Pseudohyphozyma bogoriensis]|nr:hypothetical protein MNV49_007922 [Pseudohyphozyma bogoriensis]